jgi:hypothetical protein
MVWFLWMISVVAGRLLAVLEVCRHGARAPITLQPWENASVWPEGEGGLTAAGMRQHYLLGAELRRRYALEQNLLSPTMNASEFYVFSSPVERCIMSAQSQLLGLYPAESGRKMNRINESVEIRPPIHVNTDDIPSGDFPLPFGVQVVPIHNDEEERQFQIVPKESCEYYGELIDEREGQKSEIQKLFDKYEDVVNVVMEELGWNKETAQKKFRKVMDSVTSGVFHGKTVPERFTSQDFIERGEKLSILLKNFHQFEPEFLSRLAGSFIFTQILNDFNAVISKETARKLFIYSGHDTTLSFMLAFLKFDYSNAPVFASTFIFELSEENDTYFITIKYNDVEQKLENCEGQKCSFDEFKEFVERRRVNDYKKVCSEGLTKDEYEEYIIGKNNDYWIIILIIFAILLVVFIGIGIFYAVKNRNEGENLKSTKEGLLQGKVN